MAGRRNNQPTPSFIKLLIKNNSDMKSINQKCLTPIPLIMKKTLLLLMLLLTSVGVDAQWKIGRVKQDFKVFSKCLNGNNENDWSYEKDDFIVYSENRNGTVTTIYVVGAEAENMEIVSYSNISKFIDFTGYYIADVRDPVDNYVNVRKGPGTNYPILGKLNVGQGILFMKSDNNWLKVYVPKDGVEKSEDGFLGSVGEIYSFWYEFCNTDTGEYVFCNIEDKYSFIGYIYKDRVKNQDYYSCE